MKNALISIGSIVVALVILGIPVLLTCSFVYDWFDFFKFVLFIATLLDLVVVATAICLDNADQQEGV